MAKLTRAPARRSRASKTMRRARKPPRRSRVPAHRSYTPELLANGRHRYEQTPEPVAAIAADFRIHPGSLRRLAYRLGWVRYNMGPRELPPASRILSQAEELEGQGDCVCLHPPLEGEGRRASHGDASRGGVEVPPQIRLAQHSPHPDRLRCATAIDPPPPWEGAGGQTQAPFIGVIDSSTIDRLEKAVVEELATVEAMRARLKGLPRRPREAETTARTLSSLTETLQKLQRLRCTLPPSGSYDDDDMPADIDEFRNDLARRIDAFVASRTEPRAAGGDAAAPVAEV